ncbi:jg10896 [Pararge aegeria aegeria]|uniref:Jg10896 protein n=1 Tax=Pararge aegeria aegeria TaxID=348720 RepID=A0A8S4SIP0_9NEOP|nr:jg10896 [Pararge aegeria aegeria]
MGEPAQQSMATLPATANRLFQEAKEQIELSGNTDIAIKHKVLENLAAMYEIVLRLSESRQTLQIQLERARAHSIDQVLAKIPSLTASSLTNR